jgi:hypothetical protein
MNQKKVALYIVEHGTRAAMSHMASGPTEADDVRIIGELLKELVEDLVADGETQPDPNVVVKPVEVLPDSGQVPNTESLCCGGDPDLWCKSCGWDPDGHYCMNRDVISIRISQPGAQKNYSAGLALSRAFPICQNKYFEKRDKK